MSKHIKCPSCGAWDSIPIMYGMPGYEAFELSEKGKIALGGCIITEGNPSRECTKCKKQFGGKRLAFTSIAQFDFFIGGYMDTCHYIRIDLSRKGLFKKYVIPPCNFYDFDKPEYQDNLVLNEEIPMLPDEYMEFEEALDSLYLLDWKRNYHNNNICDGEQWRITIKPRKGRKISFYGSNAYPPYWKQFIKLIGNHFPSFAEKWNGWEEIPTENIETATSSVPAVISSTLSNSKLSSAFANLLYCTKYHKSALISYRGLKDIEPIPRKIDPYRISWFNSNWYIKAFCHYRNELRTFAINRVETAEILDESFEVPTEIEKAPITDTPFEFDPITDIEVWCSSEIATTFDKTVKFYIEKEAMPRKDGSVTFYIKRAPKNTVINWVLAQNGQAKVINPKDLAEEIEFFIENDVAEIF